MIFKYIKFTLLNAYKRIYYEIYYKFGSWSAYVFGSVC